MGLFGLFAVLFGAGTAAKEWIDGEIEDTKSHDKAIRENRSTYIANGKFRSTKTGQPVRFVHDWNTGHDLIVDSKTGVVIEDETVTKNKRNEEIDRQKAKAKGCIFYRCHQWDSPSGISQVYISDVLPGYFYKRDENEYQRGELIDMDRGKRKYVRTKWKVDRFRPDGTPRTDADYYIDQNANNKRIAIRRGSIFYECEFPDKSHNKYFGNVNDDKCYVYNYKGQYYVEGIVTQEEVRAEPHHPEMVTVSRIKEDPNATRYNSDGTVWVP